MAIGQTTRHRLDRVREFYDSAAEHTTWGGRQYRSALARIFRNRIPASASILEIGCGSGSLLSDLPNEDKTGIDLSSRQLEAARARNPGSHFHQTAGEELVLDRTFDYVILSDILNQAADVQLVLDGVRRVSDRNTRVILNHYRARWQPIIWLLTEMGLRARQPKSNWLSTRDIINLLELSDFEVVSVQPRILSPINLPPFRWIDALFAPLLGPLCLTVFIVARVQSIPMEDKKVSVIIPARNEAGNIENAVRSTPEMGEGTEIIFVEGHSTDGTWEEIGRVRDTYDTRKIIALQQPGEGKGDAVRAGFQEASGDVLMILDGDLTVPPEDLPKFYESLISGRAEVANGVRLVYPVERRSMRFLNHLANRFFSVVFSWLLGQTVKDTLCGTKAMLRETHFGIDANRHRLTKGDPFGDFDVLLGAGDLNLKIRDIPIRYSARTYGSTNINRWRHGFMLLRVAGVAARELKFI
jgi:SAM-dependent methyltransferase